MKRLKAFQNVTIFKINSNVSFLFNHIYIYNTGHWPSG